uniref:Uncharacterized protein n=1 Tax=Strigops habroptila TaxID=2489341 RepID=A0A672TZP9_STRHB
NCPRGSARLPLPLTGLQRAPCGCFFNPQLFSMQWTSPNVPPADTSTLGYGAAALPGAALLGPGGCGTLPAWAAPGTPQGPNPGFGEPAGDIEVTEEMLLKEALRLFGMSEDVEGVIQDGPEPDIPSAATSVGTTLGINIPPGSDIPPSSSADPHNQGLGDLRDSLAHYKEVPLEEALRFFSCYEDTEGVSREGPSSSPMPEDPGGTDTEIPLYDFTSLSLPEELLTCDYSVLEKAKVIQSFEDASTIEMEPYGWWADLGMDLEPSQPGAPNHHQPRQNPSPTSPSPFTISKPRRAFFFVGSLRIPSQHSRHGTPSTQS